MGCLRLRCRLHYRLNREQKKVMSGKIPMTEKLFWACLDVFFQRYEREKFWELWNKYPIYVRKNFEEWEERDEDCRLSLKSDR